MLRRDRSWVILRLEEGNVWRQVTAMMAPTRKMAVDRVTQGELNPYTTGTFKAIPSKAWAHEIVVDDIWKPQEC